MLILNKIEDAVARYHVVRYELPKRALVPQAEFDRLAITFGAPRHASVVHVPVKAGQDVGTLAVEAGKVTDVTLYRERT